jgi:hypothetical protein
MSESVLYLWEASVMRPSLNLSEANIRYAMENTQSNKEASEFLNVDIKTYKKYAKLFIDSSSNKSLWEIHKRIDKKGIPKKRYANKDWLIKYTITEILQGKFPHLTSGYVKDRLLNCGHYPPVCSHCGFNERRIDGKIPLVLDYLDGDRTNHREDNIRILCYNCSFMLAGEWRAVRHRESWHKKDFITPADLEYQRLKIPK